MALNSAYFLQEVAPESRTDLGLLDRWGVAQSRAVG